ncbi:MAG TPA: pyridoxal-dependent decarboxylase [Candidatus Limnocylindrales bacterium]|nr:pyridoxal-dependent decarboxylase [Candidatus Limnocylindrales bacterium]
MALKDTDRRTERFAWHPEPDLLGFGDEAARPALEQLGHDAWAAALDYLYDHAFVRAMGEPAGYAELRETFFGPTGRPAEAPAEPTPSGELLEEFRTRVAPHQLNAYHPRSLSYFTPPPLAMSVIGELLAQVMQQGVDVWHAGPLATFVEEEVVRWLCDLVGYDDAGFGLLTSGGVMANFLAMALVRDVHLPAARGDARPARGRALEGVRFYTSDQTHFSIARALDELGFPADTLVVLPTDDRFRLQPEPVREAIARDRAAGLTPVAISAVAGSTNTGSVDLIEPLAEVARGEGLWLHVDAAYGAAARLSERDEARVPGLELADSVTVDPHKWFFQAYDVGGLMVRDGSLLERTFGGRKPEYYRGGEGPASGATGGDHHDGHDVPGQLNFYKLGFEGTRRWRALKLWMSWKHIGTRGFGRLIEDNVDLAQLLARRCAESDDFEALPPEPELSVVCFRHLPADVTDSRALDHHQDRLQAALEADGDGWLSTTSLRGSTWLRAGIVNPHTVPEDIDRLLATLRRLAADLA